MSLKKVTPTVLCNVLLLLCFHEQTTKLTFKYNGIHLNVPHVPIIHFKRGKSINVERRKAWQWIFFFRGDEYHLPAAPNGTIIHTSHNGAETNQHDSDTSCVGFSQFPYLVVLNLQYFSLFLQSKNRL